MEDARFEFPRPGTLFRRALRLRCPVCGFRLDRHEPGYWLGSYTVNLFATEGVFVAFFVTGLFLFWPDVPWQALTVGGLATVLVTPVLLFPFTKTCYLAIDLSFRPPEPPDLVTPIERGFLAPRTPSGTAEDRA